MPSLVMDDSGSRVRQRREAGCVLERPPDTRSLQLHAKAPLRVSFAGGGTDVAPFPEREGGAVLCASIARYAYGGLTPRNDGAITVSSDDLGLSLAFGVSDQLKLNGELDLVKAPICRLSELGGGERGGYRLTLHSCVPPGSGLGSSSTLMVALVGLLRARYALQMDSYQLAHLAYQLEREDLGIRGGMQDQYAAVFGGFNYIEFFGGHVLVNPLRIRDDTIHELEHNLLLCFTGHTRASDGIISDQSARLIGNEKRTLQGLREQKELAAHMKRALLHNQLRDFGALLGEAWEQKKRISPLISTDYIDEAYSAAVRAGALGGKVTGAGGGGFMLLYCDFDRKYRVSDALRKLGISVGEVVFTKDGLKTWSPQ